MISLSRITLSAGLVLAGAAFLLPPAGARASDEFPPPAPDAATADGARIAVIPARTICVEDQVTEPPVRCEQRVPRYETVTVPVYEQKRIPVYESVERPVYETREVPVFKTERVPVWGRKEVPTYRKVKKPVTIKLWRPFACEDACIKLWDKCEDVPDGTKTVDAIVAHEERQVADGTRLERVQVGTKAEEVLVGYRCERVQVGEREERRLVGYENRSVVVAPARQRIVRKRETVAAERVTVVPNGATRDDPLPGTSRVVTESQYRELLAEDS